MSSLTDADTDQDVLLLGELHDEATYVRHHKKKIAFLFSAMRHFAEEMSANGWTVHYRKLDAKEKVTSFTQLVEHAVKKYKPEKLVVTASGEWRVQEEMEGWESQFDLPVEIRPDTRFIASIDEFKEWASGRKQLRMEYFYREMRRKTGLLMDGDKPEGEKWNFDAENRKPAKNDLFMPEPKSFKPDKITKDVLKLTEKRFADHFGDLEPFRFAVTRKDAEDAFEHFVKKSLASFGDFQDAMLTGQRFLFHSVISLYLNCGLLDPLAVCKRIEKAYRDGKAPLNAAEGFIRQIVGWREYVRGIYWLNMPGYEEKNFFGHDRSVPEFYWTGDTDMVCLHEAITQTKEDAYAHHIQRLMITGNFALLVGVDPRLLHEWYLIVYADAYEWVELPNTLGMSQFGDGGLLASKPYAASGSYINRMSDYCKGCAYDVKQRTGKKACPFNALYWDFLARNRKTLESNRRMGPMYRTYDRFDDDEKKQIKASATKFKKSL